MSDPPVSVGIDVHFCRITQTGIYAYVSSLVEQFAGVANAPDVTLLLYGPEGIAEPDAIVRMSKRFDRECLRHLWTGIPLPGRAGSVSRVRGLFSRLWVKALVSTGLVGRATRRLFERRDSPAWWNELDVVHHTAGLLLPLHPRANVLTISDLIPHHYRYQYQWEAQWFGESFERVAEMDLVLVYSEHTKQDVVRTLGVAENRIRVVPLAAHARYRPLPREAITPVLARHGLDGTPYLLHVGSLEPRKNLVRLVEAFGELLREVPALPHHLVLAGPRFSTYQPIFEAIEQLALQRRVRWVGVVPFDDLPPLMNGADAFVYPSFYEGFGLPPLEAMACGTAVIASNASSMPEVVGDAGVLVDPHRTCELTAAMRRVVQDPDLRKRLGAAGLVRSREFTWEKTATLTAIAYRDASAGKRHASGRRHAATGYHTRALVRQWLADRYIEAST